MIVEVVLCYALTVSVPKSSAKKTATTTTVAKEKSIPIRTATGGAILLLLFGAFSFLC